MNFDFGSFNMWGPLRKVAVRPPDVALASDARIDAEWKALNYHSRPDLKNARREFKVFKEILKKSGAEIIELPDGPGLTLDSLYAHDALIVTPKGLVKPVMGKPARRREANVNCDHLSKLGFPVAGEIKEPGLIEGGDLVWIDRHTLLAGIGYRTNLEGVKQLQKLAGSDVDIQWFDMPHYKGRADVFHLMSCLSPVDKDLAVVYRPLMAVRLIELLEARNISFVEVPDAEFPSMGCNVLALGPRHAAMVSGNPQTEACLRAAGVRLELFDGFDICRKGEGGPTCMTRPLVRG